MTDNDCSTSLRPDMVEAAKQFMSTPKVRGTSFEEQKKFLLEKGLTEEEIEEARKGISDSVAYSDVRYHNDGHQMYYQPPPPTFGGKLYSLTQSVVVIGGASYMAYKFMRSWVLPKFFNVPEAEDERFVNLQTQVNELQNSTKFIMDSVEQTLTTVSAQQEQLNRALMLMSGNNTKDNDMSRIQTDISIVKSLLLNQNSFPLPTTNTVTSANETVPPSTTSNGIIKPIKTVRWQPNPSIAPPSWQLAKNDGAIDDDNNHITNGITSDETDRIQSDDEQYHEAEQQINTNGYS